MNTNTSIIQTKLSCRNKYIETIRHNIMKLNIHVHLSMNSLNARDEVTNDLIVNAYKVYLACSDNQFVNCIKCNKY